MDIDKRIIYAGIILFLAASAFAVFSGEYLSDSDYALLSRSGMPMGTVQLLNAALFILLPLAAYAMALILLKSDAFHAFCASALFAFSPANAAALHSIHPFAAAALGQGYGIFEAIGIAATSLPLGLLAALEYKHSPVSAILAALGALALPFAPGPAAFVLAIAAANGFRSLENPHYGDKALVFLAFAFAFQASYSGDLAAAFVAGALLAAIAYVASALHSMKSGEIAAAALLLISFNTLSALHGVSIASSSALGAGDIAAFEAAKSISGTFGVLDYPNAFQYYSGKGAVLLNASALLKKGEVGVDYAVFSLRSLDSAYSSKPVIFRYAGTANDGQRSYAVFASGIPNANYILYMALSGAELAIDDAQLYGTGTREGAIIPYTKMRMLGNGTFSDPSTRMINIQAIEDSVLQSLLFSSGRVFERNGSIIVEVRQ